MNENIQRRPKVSNGTKLILLFVLVIFLKGLYLNWQSGREVNG